MKIISNPKNQIYVIFLCVYSTKCAYMEFSLFANFERRKNNVRTSVVFRAIKCELQNGLHVDGSYS